MSVFDADVKSLKGIGEKTAALFEKVGVSSLWDLLTYYPRDYTVFREPVGVHELMRGETQAVGLTICGQISMKYVRKLQILTAVGKDHAGRAMRLTWFNMPYLRNNLKSGGYYIFRGLIGIKGDMFVMEQPRFFSPAEYGTLVNCCQPVYPVTKGLTSNGITKAIKQVISGVLGLEDYLTEDYRREHELLERGIAMERMHFPAEISQVLAARKRLAFDEFFFFILSIRKLREENKATPNHFPMIEVAETNRLIEELPYELTGVQKRTWQEIREDLASDHCMNRLVQGDVGSGKTIIAVLALIQTCRNGYQGAMMAPTEVLAVQHMESVTELFQKYHIALNPVLLTGSMTAKEKREAKKLIASGEADLVIGTHALIQEDVAYKALGLVVTDEQHRFGVKQRETLAMKGDSPHVLVMSATPIPRTLAIIVYGDLDISIMDELPAKRLPIKNCVVNVDYRPKAYHFIENEVKKGRQVYIICPMVEESEAIEAENVLEYTEKLKESLPSAIRVSYLHGKLKPKEKNEIMEHFAKGDIDVLVSTTVVEVGVNVPNASVMMVENAERFGLAQLHQLRGRVGRGEHQSYCIFVSGNDRKETKERLEILNKSNDGFVIANEDLKMRGPGDLFGLRQSGIMDFRVGDIMADARVLKLASDYAEEILAEDYELQEPSHQLMNQELKRYQSRRTEKINL